MTLILSGHLQLLSTEDTGTVAALDGQQKVLATTTTTADGRFTFNAEIAGPGCRLYGFPGQSLNDDSIASALQTPDAVYYEALIPETTSPWISLYLNAGSSMVTAAHKANIAENQVQKKVKSLLFGEAVGLFMPGYTADFIAHIAHPEIFDASLFLSKSLTAGGPAALSDQLLHQTDPENNKAPAFATPKTAAVSTEAPVSAIAEAPSSIVIPRSATWACNVPDWLDTLDAEGGVYTDTMTTLSEVSDGLAASVGTEAAGLSLGDLAANIGKSAAGSLVSFAASQLFGLVEGWIFGQPVNPVLEILQNISKQLQTVINNQIKVLNDLNAIMNVLHTIQQDAILEHLTQPLTTIQANAQNAYNFSISSKSGVPSAMLITAAGNITDPNVGVTWALQDMHNLITGASGAMPLPQAVFECYPKPSSVNGLNQNFLSNENFYLKIQGLYHYYASIQTQGVQLVMQAYNYLQNQNISNNSTPYPASPSAISYYNNWLIGGSTANGTIPNLVIQREGYRASFQAYYQNFQGYMGALPDDMAICLVPHSSGQIAPIFYSIEGGFLVLGYVSYLFRIWTAGNDVLNVQPFGTVQNWGLPAVLQNAFHYPSPQDLQNMIGEGIGNNGNYYSYLQAQGFTDDSATYGTSYFQQATIWTNTHGNYNSVHYYHFNWPSWTPQYNPIDINGHKLQMEGMTPPPAHYSGIQGNLPIGISLQGNPGGSFNTGFYSSNPYNPHQDPAAWNSPTNQIYGGLIVAEVSTFTAAASSD
ncbi:hypothetical protein DBR43_30125 [Pedobacter sp. KBW06]|uniref:hypothetical protein n=1 Tax=Pedobacter sp. KBW06 TaxID=2153359 RepID=UPI000F5B778B|nr:hypothetical protein [Pedobacter sp. KBW06]RQO66467.1 hypothetical protein DBR43_30125 [Pedobacter sp. KBW06]